MILLLPKLLVRLQIRQGFAENALQIGKLTWRRRRLKVEVLDFEDSRICANDLALEVILVLYLEDELGTLLLYLTSTLDGGVFEAAVVAGEGFEKHLFEEWYANDRYSSDALHR